MEWAIRRAGELRAEGRLQAALGVLAEALVADPYSGDVLALKAEIELEMGDARQAESTSLRAISAGADRAGIYRVRALALLALGEPDRAQVAGDIALSRGLDAVKRAELSEALGRFGDAGDAWLAADRASGDVKEGAQHLGRAGLAFMRATRWLDAVAALRGAVPWWWMLEGRILPAELVRALAEAGQSDEAWQELPSFEALERQGSDVTAFRNVTLECWKARVRVVPARAADLVADALFASTPWVCVSKDDQVEFQMDNGSEGSVYPTAEDDGYVSPWSQWTVDLGGGLTSTVDVRFVVTWEGFAEATWRSADGLLQQMAARQWHLAVFDQLRVAFAKDPAVTVLRWSALEAELRLPGAAVDVEIQLEPSGQETGAALRGRLYWDRGDEIEDFELEVAPSGLMSQRVLAAIAQRVPADERRNVPLLSQRLADVFDMAGLQFNEFADRVLIEMDGYEVHILASGDQLVDMNSRPTFDVEVRDEWGEHIVATSFELDPLRCRDCVERVVEGLD